MKHFESALVLVLFCIGLVSAGRDGSSSSESEGSSDESDCQDSVERPEIPKKPVCTGKGEKYLECGEYQYCDQVCNRLDEPCDIQYAVCPFGCQCPKGFAYKPGTKDCVKIEDCAQAVIDACPVNQVWSDCANHCTDHCKRAQMLCTFDCQSRCMCDIKNGFYMNDDGICVPEQYCDIHS